MKKGFTLLEILLVIAAIGILAAIVIVAINPNRQLAQARNAQRRSDVNTILNALYQYNIDNNGSFPGTIDTTLREVSSGQDCTQPGTAPAADIADTNLSALAPDYLSSLPTDPQWEDHEIDGGSGEAPGCTGYTVLGDGNGRVTVAAPETEQPETSPIDVTR
jgi:prepilin-type N-terminal cleavage/methylation domain-containing protein